MPSLGSVYETGPCNLGVKMKSVSILATGSEVVSGQIINTNAAWLAQKLSKLNLDVNYHWAVADDPLKILEALEYLSGRSDAVFVTGGLGPTTDDLTRKLVADWLGLKLNLVDKEWERIQERVLILQVEAREGHKWQAYFPEGAEIYTNLVGTASGFSLKRKPQNTELYFLPGPPVEMEYIWETHLEERVRLLAPAEGLKLLTWQFIELPESEVAYIADTVVDELKFLSGYRAMPPIVEFKLWAPPSFDPSKSGPILRLENEFRDYLHSINEFNYLWESFRVLSKSNTEVHLSIEDHLTEGEFLNRVVELKKKNKKELSNLKYTYATDEMLKKQPLHLEIKGVKNESVHIKLWQDQNLLLGKEIKIKRLCTGQRFKRWVCEVTSKALHQHFENI